MYVKDYIAKNINEYPLLYRFETYEKSAFAVLHHVFIVLGNGMEWADTEDPNKGGYITEPQYDENDDGDYTRIKDAPYGEEKHTLVDPEFGEDGRAYKLAKLFKRTYDTVYDAPYPNFRREYSLFWEIDPKLIKPDWRQAAIEHLKHWEIYFNDPERFKYWSNYKNTKSCKEYVENYYKDKKPNWIEAVRCDYKFPDFDGVNYEEMEEHRWQKRLSGAKQFIADTLALLES